MTWSVHTLQKVYKLGVFTTTPQLQSLRCSSVYICFTVLLLLFFSSSYFFSACCGSFVPVQSGPDSRLKLCWTTLPAKCYLCSFLTFTHSCHCLDLTLSTLTSASAEFPFLFSSLLISFISRLLLFLGGKGVVSKYLVVVSR